MQTLWEYNTIKKSKGLQDSTFVSFCKMGVLSQLLS